MQTDKGTRSNLEELLLLRGSQLISKKIIRLKKIHHDHLYANVAAIYTPKTKYVKKISIDKNKTFVFLNLEKDLSSYSYHNNDRLILAIRNSETNYFIIFKSMSTILNCFKFENKLPNNPIELFQYENSTVSGLV